MPFIQLQLRRGTSNEWSNTITGNPILANGEIGLDTTLRLFKIGDGSNTWNNLSYGGLQGVQGVQGTNFLGANVIFNSNVNSNAAISATKLSFTQNGSNASPRTVDAKLKDIVSVKDFGAKGDGATDDTAAIKAAILAGASGSVYFPRGSYLISDTLTISNTATRLYGDGPFASRIEMQANNLGIIYITGQHCRFDNFSVNYTTTPISGATAISIASEYIGGNDFMVRSGWIGILVQNSAQVYLSKFTVLDTEASAVFLGGENFDCYFDQFYVNCGNKLRGTAGNIRIIDQNEAIVFTDGDVLEGKYTLVTDAASNTNGNRPAYIKFNSVFFDSSDYSTLFANSALFVFTSCWWSNGRSDLTGSQLSGVDQPACSITGAVDSFTFDNCHFVSGGTHGVFLGSAAARTTFIGCNFNSNNAGPQSGNAYGFLASANASNFTITGSIATNGLGAGTQQYGIFIDTGCNRFVIQNCNLENNSVGGLLDNSSNNAAKVISGNIGIPYSFTGNELVIGNQISTGSWISTADINTVWQLGANPPVYNIANNGTRNLATGSGLVLVMNITDASGAAFFCQGGNVFKLGGSAAIVEGAPNANQMGLKFDSGPFVYVLENKLGAAKNVKIVGIQARSDV